MKNKLIKNETYNIHLIPNDKFKTVEMKIYFKNNFCANDCYINAFLFELLTESTKKYPTLRELQIKCEELYNAKIFNSTNRSGNTLINSLVISFLNPKYVKEKNYLNDLFELFFSIIFNPNIKNDKFDNNIIEIIKSRIINTIERNKEHPIYNLGINSVKAMDPKSPSAVEVIGTPELVNNITNEDLIQAYKNVLEHSYIDIYISGDINEDIFIDLINKYASFKTIKNHEVSLYLKNKKKYFVTKKKDFTKYNQSHIAMIYTTDNLSNYERKYTMNVFDIILGGGSLETKLYRTIREELSLCYSISSVYNPLDNTFCIYTSVDNKNINKTIKCIKKVFNEMKNKITKEELKNAINVVLSNINEQSTSVEAIISSEHYKYEAGLDEMIEKIKNYKKTDIESIYNLFNKVKLNTIYVLEGTTYEEN